MAQLHKHNTELEESTRIGNLLKLSGAVSEETLAKALEKQKRETVPVGKILKDEGAIDEHSLHLHLRQQKLLRNIYKEAAESWINTVTKLGHILTDLKLVDSEHVESAIEDQKSSQKPLGEILVEKGHLSVGQLHDALEHQSATRAILVGALIALITASATLPYMAEAAASSTATASITITLRILPKPLVELTEPPTQDGGGVLTLHGASFTQDSDGNFFVTPISDMPSGQPVNSVNVPFSQLSDQSSGTMNIFVTGN